MNRPSAGNRPPNAASAALLPLLGFWIVLGATLFHGPVAAVVTGGGTLAAAVVLHRTVRSAHEPLRGSVRRGALRASMAGLAALAAAGIVYAAGRATGGGDGSATASGVLAGIGAAVSVVAATLVAATRTGRR
ncbi:hypothetical protein [Actinomadura harenae]|uniref:Uncharacterized protein n=1 Tax=Actinomadura harenae TaxID=2483351 RepID=A0A3M2LQK5_9ACTN|nr:hypothetical protein [Actinomadura harenae]RMI39761.1 hypothetical protein EBO15_28515 [Actinomadura harenae]